MKKTMKRVLALSKNNNVDELIDTDRKVKLVSGRDFYKDYISFLKDKKEKIMVELDRHIQKRSAIINTFRSHFDTFKEYYIIRKPVVRGGVNTVDIVRNYTFDDIVILIGLYSKLKGCTFVPYKEPTPSFEKLINNKLDQLSDINFDINLCRCELEDIKQCMLDYNDYKTASDLYNQWSIKHCLDGGRIIFARKMGSISIKKLTRDYTDSKTKVRVDYVKSKAYKKYLIANNRIPYKKEDHMAAIARGEEYKGEEWLIYDYTEQYLFIKWSSGTYDRSLYEFTPTRGNNAFKCRQDLVDIFNRDHDLEFVFGCNLGFVNYMNLFKDVIPGYNNKFEDVTMSK